MICVKKGFEIAVHRPTLMGEKQNQLGGYRTNPRCAARTGKKDRADNSRVSTPYTKK